MKIELPKGWKIKNKGKWGMCLIGHGHYFWIEQKDFDLFRLHAYRGDQCTPLFFETMDALMKHIPHFIQDYEGRKAIEAL